MRLPPLPSIKDILRLYKIRALKQLSQNFLLNPRITKRLVRCAGSLTDHHVIEVGPGPGSITRSILNVPIKKLVVVEKDNRFLPGLEMLKEVSTIPLEIIHGDILRYDLIRCIPTDLKTEWDTDFPKIHILGNLPFNVSTPLIIQWLRQMSKRLGPWSYGRVKMTLTFQKEVGERLMAETKDEQRSRLSIMSQYLSTVKMVDIIPGKAFLPKPDVDVAVVTFFPRIEPLIQSPFEHVEKVVSLIFHHRNKIFKNCISTFFPPERPELTEELGNRSEIDVEKRPRELTLDDFSRLCHIYTEMCAREPGLFEYNYRSRRNVSQWKKRKAIWQGIHGEDYFVNDEDDDDLLLDERSQPDVEFKIRPSEVT